MIDEEALEAAARLGDKWSHLKLAVKQRQVGIFQVDDPFKNPDVLALVLSQVVAIRVDYVHHMDSTLITAYHPDFVPLSRHGTAGKYRAEVTHHEEGPVKVRFVKL